MGMCNPFSAPVSPCQSAYGPLQARCFVPLYSLCVVVRSDRFDAYVSRHADIGEVESINLGQLSINMDRSSII